MAALNSPCVVNVACNYSEWMASVLVDSIRMVPAASRAIRTRELTEICDTVVEGGPLKVMSLGASSMSESCDSAICMCSVSDGCSAEACSIMCGC